MSIFKPHGSFKAHVQGRVLIAHCRGSWNIEMHQEQGRQSQALVETLEQGGNWGSVVVVHDSLVSSLAVLEAGRLAVENMPSPRKLVALAWVIAPTVEGYSLLKGRYARMYEGLLQTRTFDNEAGAVYWIEKMITEAPKANAA